MSNYISREAILKRLHEVGGCGAPPDSWADGYDKAIDLAYGIVENDPAADVAPVVHGEWIEKQRHEHFPSGKPYIADYCSVCGKRGSAEYNYCPNCGAKMGGKHG